MVVFTCNHCGDSLQKPKVEKHYNFVCRKLKSLTCVDCFKDFKGEEYAVHTKCITEEERYAAKGSIPNGIVKKGEVKQESWMEMIKSIIDQENNLKPSVKKLLGTISTYDNVPRKKSKFLNFIKSSSGGRVNMKDVEDVWNIIEKYKNNKEQSKGENTVENNQSNGIDSKVDNDELDLVAKKQMKDAEQKNDMESSSSKTSKKRKSGEAVNLDAQDNETKKQKKVKNTEENNQSNGIDSKVDNDESDLVAKKQMKDAEQKNDTESSNSKTSKKRKSGEAVNLDAQDNETKKQKKKSIDHETNDSQSIKENIEENVTKKSKKKKKVNNEENQDIPESNEQSEEMIENVSETKKFDFEECILNVLQSKDSISLKKLEKKILKKYLKHSGELECSDKVIKKFNKKLKKLSNVQILDDVVSLSSQ